VVETLVTTERMLLARLPGVDMRTGVFSRDFLGPLSRVASENLRDRREQRRVETLRHRVVDFLLGTQKPYSYLNEFPFKRDMIHISEPGTGSIPRVCGLTCRHPRARRLAHEPLPYPPFTALRNVTTDALSLLTAR